MKTWTVDLYKEWDIPDRGGPGGLLDCRFLDGGTDRAVLVVPGGGYEHVSDREGAPVAAEFLARGWSTAVLRYSVAPARFPVQLREGAMAMAYLRRQGMERIAAVGFSAGGHLCGTLATLFDSPEVADIAPASHLRPDVLGLCYPVAVSHGATHAGSFANLCGGDEALKARLSLDTLVRGDMPPVFLWGTRDDGSVPARNFVLLAGALEAAGVDFAFHLYRHGRHGLSTARPETLPAGEPGPLSWDVAGWVEAMGRFFAEG